MDNDAGHDLLGEVTEWARNHSVALVKGHVPMTLDAIELELDEGANVGGQLCGRLEELKPYLIVANVSILTSDEIDDSVETLIARDAGADELSATRSCTEFVGQIASLIFHIFIKDGPVSLEYTYNAPWFDYAYQEDVPDDSVDLQDQEEQARYRAEQEERQNRYRAEQEERDKWTAAARTKAARQIAADSRFAKAKTRSCTRFYYA